MGIDPGIAITGYGIIDNQDQELELVQYGVITTPANQQPAERLMHLHQQLNELLVSFSPDVAAVEQLFFGNNSRTAISVGQARGVILLTLAEHQLPIFEYTPMQIKQAISGYGQADKSQVQHMIALLLGLSTTVKPDDAADALAIAICYHHSARWEAITRSEEAAP